MIFSLIPRLQEPEALFRILVGLGTLLAATQDSEDRNELVAAVRQSETALTMLRNLSEDTSVLSSQNKLANCSKQIIDLIFWTIVAMILYFLYLLVEIVQFSDAIEYGLFKFKRISKNIKKLVSLVII